MGCQQATYANDEIKQELQKKNDILIYGFNLWEIFGYMIFLKLLSCVRHTEAIFC